MKRQILNHLLSLPLKHKNKQKKVTNARKVAYSIREVAFKSKKAAFRPLSTHVKAEHGPALGNKSKWIAGVPEPAALAKSEPHVQVTHSVSKSKVDKG